MKNKKNILWKITFKYFPIYFISIVFLIFHRYIDSYISLFIGQTIAILSNGENVLPDFLLKFINFSSTHKAIVSLSMTLLVMSLILIVGRFISNLTRRIYTKKLLVEVSVSFYEHSIKLPASYLSSISTGNLIQRCIDDTNNYARFYDRFFFNIFDSLTMTFIYLVQIFLLSKVLFYIGLVASVFVLCFSLFFGYFYIRKKEKEVSDLSAKLDSMGQQSFSNINLVKSFDNEKEEERKFNEVNKEKEELAHKVQLLHQTYWVSIDIFHSLFRFGAFLFVGYSYIKGRIDLGLATTLVLLSTKVLQHLPNLLNSLNRIIKFSVSISRLQEYFRKDDEYSINGDKTPNIEGDIIFTNVNKSYDNNHVLKNISLTVKQGETIGIIGRSGSGKSTLVNLLTRLIEYDDGSLTINGVEIKDIEKRHLRENLSFVNQQAYLFAKTVEDNLTILEKSRDFTPYVHQVDLHNDIKDFEYGYQTIVGERGVTLSGGQRQRMSIVRSMLKNKKILVLDDSLSAVDNNISKSIRQNIKNINATTFIISHNLINVMDADKIIVLSDGKIIESGNHDSLLKEQGHYYKIWNLQQKLEEVTSNEGK